MNITFYINNAENSRIDKTNYLEEVLSIEGTLRDSCSITNPVIQVQHLGFLNVNYVYIEEFNRYYFINDIVSVRLNIWEIHMTVDVLMSFNSQIKNLNGYVSRYQYSEEYEYIDSTRLYKSIPKFEVQKLDFKAPWFPLLIHYTEGYTAYENVSFCIVMSSPDGPTNLSPPIQLIGTTIKNFDNSIKYNNIKYELGFNGFGPNSCIGISNNIIICGYDLLVRIIAMISKDNSLITHIVDIFILPSFPEYKFNISNYNDDTNAPFYDDCAILIEHGENDPSGTIKGHVGDDIINRSIVIDDSTYYLYDLYIGDKKVPTQGTSYFLLTPSANHIFSCSYLISEGIEANYKNIPPITTYSLFIPMYGNYDIQANYLINRKLFMNVYFDVTMKSHSVALYSCGDTADDIILVDTLTINTCSSIPLTSNGSENVERQRSYNKMVRDIGYLSNTFNYTASIQQDAGGMASDLLGPRMIGKKGLTKRGTSALVGGISEMSADSTRYIGQMISTAMQYKANEILNVSTGTSKNNFDSVSTSYQLLSNSVYMIKTILQSTIDDDNFAKLVGLPYNKYIQLSQLTGFFIVSDIHLENITALDEEKDEIYNLLTSGVIG